jgi:hypothetical protein
MTFLLVNGIDKIENFGKKFFRFKIWRKNYSKPEKDIEIVAPYFVSIPYSTAFRI